MKKFFYYIMAVVFATCWYSCKEEGRIYYFDSNAPAPEQVSDLEVVNIPGGAIITYKIPKDNNFSYVKAIYEIQPGVFREAKSSFYKDTLDLVGFGDTLIHKVDIYSVGRNEKVSEPLSVEVKPLIPPVKSVFETLTFEATFGGVNVTFTNSDLANLVIVVLMDDITEQGAWIPIMTYYTAAMDGDFSVRGLEPEERKFAVYIRDRWDNKSDTLVRTLTPLYESLIPKSTWKALHLPGDFWQPLEPRFKLENVWDGITTETNNIFATVDYITLPQWFTIDLNQTVIFSRMMLHQRLSHPYHAVWVKTFEVWGTNDYDPDGGWNNWVFLDRFNSRTPSGSVWPNYTADDMAYQRVGEDFMFTQPVPAIRYIRIKVLDSYGGVGKYQFCELTFWGQIVN